jgi:hypothetical protein
MSAAKSTQGDVLDVAFDRLHMLLPRSLSRALAWLRTPHSRWLRIPLGVLCLIGGMLWFLPVVGLELLPIGLLLVAQDVPMLRGPAGRLTLRLLNAYEWIRRWWERRRGGKSR